MARIPVFERETKLNGAPLPYENYNLNEYMFGGGEAKAFAKVADDFNAINKVAEQVHKQLEDTQILEFANKLDNWEEVNLYNKDTGYFNLTGKNAVGKSTEVMKNYDDFIKDYQSDNKMSIRNKQRMQDIALTKRNRIVRGVNAHDVEETKNWAVLEAQQGLNNAIKGMVNSRNNPDEIKIFLANIDNIIDWQAQTQRLDEDTVKALKSKAHSDAHSAVLDTLINEGDLRAGQYFDEHKDEINADKHAVYIGRIKNEEMKYQARDMANNIIATSKSEAEAIKRAESIEDVNMSDSVLSRVRHHYSQEEHLKDVAERDALDKFYNTVIQKQKSGQTISYDDIPNNIDPKTKLGLMNYVNSNGQPETDNEIWETLYQKSVNDAQGFAKEDLNKYRGYLSDTEYKSFIKRQQDIQAGGYYTVIQDDDKKIKAALKVIGLDSTKRTAVGFSEVKALVREFEARKGRKINQAELNNIINSLGYKGSDGAKIYKQLEKGMAERTGFIRDVINDFSYYQSKHNGELPPDSEKHKIILNRVNQKVQEKRTTAQQNISYVKDNATVMRNIAYTVAKPNEQKVLTYFADNQVPAIGKKLGVKLTVTSRYRNQAGSHHKEGRAADISMSEHKTATKIKIYEQLLALPTVYKIGTSDPNILTHFNGNSKLIDERQYDKQHGTNHVNHAHVTLINANPARPADSNKIAQNNTYKF